MIRSTVSLGGASAGVWTAYTPIWASGTGTQPTPGNSVRNGSYLIQGKLCHIRIRLTIGTTAVFAGTAYWHLSVPPIVAEVPGLYGHAYVAGLVPVLLGQTAFALFGAIASGQWVAANWPGNWAAGDSIELFGSLPL